VTRALSNRLVFIESICNDEKMIASNVREVKLKSPDYQHEDEAFAVADFLRRIEQYKVCVCFVCLCTCCACTPSCARADIAR
jgi:hypothetical protein